MSVVRGLNAINKYLDKANRQFDDRPPVRWVKIGDGDNIKITFLQELDPDSPSFNSKAGTAFIAPEHSNPEDFRKKALCTIDEGGCVGCEQNKAHPKTGWNVRGRLYVNVLVDDGKEEPYVGILSQGTSGKSITPTLAMFAADSGTITSMQFRIKRSGSGTSTEYSLVPIMNSTGVNVDDYDLFDLEKCATRHIPYEEQAEFYGISNSEPDTPLVNDSMSW